VESLVLLRGLLPDLPVRPGAVLHGRVVDGRTLVLEGLRLAARLPDDVRAGDVLRLRVEEASAERLHLRIQSQVEPPAAQSTGPGAAVPVAVAVQVPLPGGAAFAVLPDGEGAGGRAGRSGAVNLRFESPGLGRLDIRLDGQAATVHVSDGKPAARVRAAVAELRAALSGALGRPVAVTVHPRARTLDASA